MLIKVGGLDPSLRNFGLAKGIYDTVSQDLIIQAIHTEQTENEKGKTVRQSSDDLRCATMLVKAQLDWISDCDAVFGEIPSGSQSARGSFSNGVCLGVMASVGYAGKFQGKLVQVNPLEVKRQAIGSKYATKEEMITWAMGRWPHLPWIITSRGKNKGLPSPDNEHMADACAAIHAGILTDEFKSLVQMLNVLSQAKLSDAALIPQ